MTQAAFNTNAKVIAFVGDDPHPGTVTKVHNGPEYAGIGPYYDVANDLGGTVASMPSHRVHLDLGAVRADLAEASGHIDNPDAQHNWPALKAIRTAENLLAEVERLRTGIGEAVQDLKADAWRHMSMAAEGKSDFWGIRSKANNAIAAAYEAAAKTVSRLVHAAEPPTAGDATS